MYLVILSSRAHVDKKVILGISKTNDGVFGILWNNTLLSTKLGYNFADENISHKINVYKISDDDYNYLSKIEGNRSEIIDEMFEEYQFDSSDNDAESIFWYGVYVSEDDNKIVFTEEQCKKIKQIIKQSVNIFKI